MATARGILGDCDIVQFTQQQRYDYTPEGGAVYIQRKRDSEGDTDRGGRWLYALLGEVSVVLLR